MTTNSDKPINVRMPLGLLTEEDVAITLGLRSVDTLATWRSKRLGPPSVKLGKGVFYRFSDVQAWIAQQAAAQQFAGEVQHQADVDAQREAA